MSNLFGKIKNGKMNPDKRNTPNVLGSANAEKIKKFVIPKKECKKKKLNLVSFKSSEYQRDYLPILIKSFYNHSSVVSVKFEKFELITNEKLQNDYTERKKELKFMGRNERELSDGYAFYLVRSNHELEFFTSLGPKTNSSTKTVLGHPEMGVCLQKHFDVMSPESLIPNKLYQAILYKYIKGKVKTVAENHTFKNYLEPTPNCDVHLSRNNITAGADLKTIYFSSQIYLFEYGDEGIVRRPRQILPFAVVTFSCKTTLNANVSQPKRSSISRPMESSNTTSSRDQYNVWNGTLRIRNCQSVDVGIFSTAFAIKPTRIGNSITVSKALSLSQMRKFYFGNLTRLSKKRQCPTMNHYLMYFELRCLTTMVKDKKFFEGFITYLQSKIKAGIALCEDGVQLILMPTCQLSYELGLSSSTKEAKASPILHCLFVSRIDACSRLASIHLNKVPVAQRNDIFDTGFKVETPFKNRIRQIVLKTCFSQQLSMKKNLDDAKYSAAGNVPYSPTMDLDLGVIIEHSKTENPLSSSVPVEKDHLVCNELCGCNKNTTKLDHLVCNELCSCNKNIFKLDPVTIAANERVIYEISEFFRKADCTYLLESTSLSLLKLLTHSESSSILERLVSRFSASIDSEVVLQTIFDSVTHHFKATYNLTVFNQLLAKFSPNINNWLIAEAQSKMNKGFRKDPRMQRNLNGPTDSVQNFNVASGCDSTTEQGRNSANINMNSVMSAMSDPNIINLLKNVLTTASQVKTGDSSNGTVQGANSINKLPAQRHTIETFDYGHRKGTPIKGKVEYLYVPQNASINERIQVKETKVTPKLEVSNIPEYVGAKGREKSETRVAPENVDLLRSGKRTYQQNDSDHFQSQKRLKYVQEEVPGGYNLNFSAAHHLKTEKAEVVTVPNTHDYPIEDAQWSGEPEFSPPEYEQSGETNSYLDTVLNFSRNKSAIKDTTTVESNQQYKVSKLSLDASNKKASTDTKRAEDLSEDIRNIPLECQDENLLDPRLSASSSEPKNSDPTGDGVVTSTTHGNEDDHERTADEGLASSVASSGHEIEGNIQETLNKALLALRYKSSEMSSSSSSKSEKVQQCNSSSVETPNPLPSMSWDETKSEQSHNANLPNIFDSNFFISPSVMSELRKISSTLKSSSSASNSLNSNVVTSTNENLDNAEKVSLEILSPNESCDEICSSTDVISKSPEPLRINSEKKSKTTESDSSHSSFFFGKGVISKSSIGDTNEKIDALVDETVHGIVDDFHRKTSEVFVKSGITSELLESVDERINTERFKSIKFGTNKHFGAVSDYVEPLSRSGLEFEKVMRDATDQLLHDLKKQKQESYFYVFNLNRDICSQLSRHLEVVVEEKRINPQRHKDNKDFGYIVNIYIHKDDVQNIRELPHLYWFKNISQSSFYIFDSVEKVQNTPNCLTKLFPENGGVIIAESSYFVQIQPESLDKVLKDMIELKSKTETSHWVLLIHSSILLNLSSAASKNKMDRERSVLQTLISYSGKRIWQVMSSHSCDESGAVLTGHLSCAIDVQQNFMKTHRHVIILSDAVCETRLQEYHSSGIDVMNVEELDTFIKHK